MNINSNIDHLTPYGEINQFIKAYTTHLLDTCSEKIAGINLTGSLSYGDFHIASSDIDITNILTSKLNESELKEIENLHRLMEASFPKWSARFECTYTPIAMLAETLPPLKPRPWYDGGEKRLYPAAPYGNEWIINKYLLYEFSITICGPDFKDITNGVEMTDVQRACLRDILEEWEPKMSDKKYFENSRNAAYFVLNLCRLMYTVVISTIGTKRKSSDWIANEFPQWNNLVVSAQQWEYGREFKDKEQIFSFAQFVFGRIRQTELYKKHFGKLQ
jgi:hypothetical protein